MPVGSFVGCLLAVVVKGVMIMVDRRVAIESGSCTDAFTVAPGTGSIAEPAEIGRTARR